MVHESKRPHRHVERAAAEVGLPASLAAPLILQGNRPTKEFQLGAHTRGFRHQCIINTAETFSGIIVGDTRVARK